LIKIKYPEFWLSHIFVIHSPLSNEQIYSYDPQKLILNDLHLKCYILEEDDENKITGRNKRNFPLPIFQKEPMGRINEFTYESSSLPFPRIKDY